MPLYKNVASQKCLVFAYDKTTGGAKTGDAGNITAAISLDGGGFTASNDANPSECDSTDGPGFYAFDLTQAETNGDIFALYPKSATSNILLEPVVVYTQIKPFLSGSINDAGADANDFDTTVTGLGNDFLNTNSLIAFVSGNLSGLSRPITDYVSVSGNITVSPDFPAAPDNGSQFVVIGYVA